MTKAELILKVAKRVGIPETEAKIFFESFLKKIAGNVNAGGAVHLEDLGVFIIKEGVSESINVKKTNSQVEHKFTDLVIFKPEESITGDDIFSADSEEALVFNIPNTKSVIAPSVDSLFSLSFGKPVVNQLTDDEMEQYFPSSRNEQKRLIEAKAEKLFSETKVFSKEEGDSDKYFFLGSKKTDTDIPDPSAEEVTLKTGLEEKFPNLADDYPDADEGASWNFGKDLQKEIDEESILDIQMEEEDIDLSKIVKDNLSWDFGAEKNLDDDAEMPGRESADNEDNYGENKFVIAGSHEDFVNNVIDNIRDDAGYGLDTDFQSVNSISSELQRLTVVEEQLNWDFGRNETEDNSDLFIEKPDMLDEIPQEDGFVQISGKRSKNKPDEEEGLIGLASTKNIISRGENTTAANTRPERKSSALQNVLKNIVMALAAVLVVAIGIYSYFKFVKHQDILNKTKLEPIFASVEIKKPEVIDRNYEVPVTYPYTKKDYVQTETAPVNIDEQQSENKQDGVKKDEGQQKVKPVEDLSEEQIFSSKNPGNILNQKGKAADKTKEIVPAKQTPKAADNKKEIKSAVKQDDMKRVNEHVFYDGSQYVIQVSSWPSKQKAESEAAKVKKLGYSAFVVSAYVDIKKAVWYRVRIGGFGSKDDAENAYKKLFR